MKYELTNEVIELSLSAKRLADDISILKETNQNLFTKLGNRLLNRAYMKTKKLSVILMETSFAIEKDPVNTKQNKTNVEPREEELIINSFETKE